MVTVIYLKLDYLDAGKEDDSGWVTESSACFENTLFEDSPEKKRRGSSHVKPSSQVAAFVSFGGNKEKSNQSAQRLSPTQHSGIQDANGKRKFSATQSQQSAPVVKEPPKRTILETELDSNFKKASKSTSFPITYKGMEAPTVPTVKGNLRDTLAVTDHHPVDKSRSTLMSPPKRMLTEKVSSKSAPMQSARNDESARKSVTVAEAALPSSFSVQRKPLSSVGLSALKAKTGSSAGEGQGSRGRKGPAPSRSAVAIDVNERPTSSLTSSHPR